MGSRSRRASSRSRIGWAPTVLRPATAHAVAATTFLCLALDRAHARLLHRGRRAGHRADRTRSLVLPRSRAARGRRDRAREPELPDRLHQPRDRAARRSRTGIVPRPQHPRRARTGAADDIARAYDTLTLSDYVACEWHLTNDFHEQRRAYARLTRRLDGWLVLNLRDVTEQRALEAQLEHRASIDALTGLPNRAALMQHLAQLGSVVGVTVLFIDLDGFKDVNDALGHESGDGVLRDVAQRIASDAPDGVYVAAARRRRVPRSHVGRRRARRARGGRRLRRRDRRPRRDADAVSRSARASGSPPAPARRSAEQLLHRADQAMYRAKAAGPGGCEFARPPEYGSRSSRVRPSRGGFGGPIPVR